MIGDSLILKVQGLDKLQKQLKEAQLALQDIDGELGTVSFNPNDPESIAIAISKMEALVDEKMGKYDKNPFVAPMIEASKEQFRASILEKASESRIENET